MVLALELVEPLADLVDDGSRDELVFTNLAGGAIHQVRFLRNHFKPAREAALPHRAGLRFHDLRHTFVSMLTDQGVNIRAIAAQAGHASAAMTLDVYGHLMPGSDGEVRKALSEAWNARPKVVPIHRPEAA